MTLVFQAAALVLIALLTWYAAKFRGWRFYVVGRVVQELLRRKEYVKAERIARLAWEQTKSFHFNRREYELLAIHNLTEVLMKQERDDDAEPLLRELIDDGHSYVKRDLVRRNALFMLSSIHGRRRDYEAQISLLLEAKTISPQGDGENWRSTAVIEHELGMAYTRRGNNTMAASCYERAALLFHGREELDEAAALMNMALANSKLGRHDEALRSLNDTLRIHERIQGSDHLQVAKVLTNMGYVQKKLGASDKAEACYRRALAIREKALGPDHDDVAGVLNNLASLLCNQGCHEEADQLLGRALGILEHSGDERLPNVLDTLATLRAAQGRIEEASALYYRSREGLQRLDGRFRQTVFDSLQRHAQILDRLDRTAEAASLRAQASGLQQAMMEDGEAKPESTRGDRDL